MTDVNEVLLLPLSHLSQAVVAPGQVSLQARQRRHHHTLHLAALRPAAGGRKAQPTDAAAGTHTAGEHVALVEHPRVDLEERAVAVSVTPFLSKNSTVDDCKVTEAVNLGGIKVSGMLHCSRVVAVVSVLDHRHKELSKHLMSGERKKGIHSTTHFVFVCFADSDRFPLKRGG